MNKMQRAGLLSWTLFVLVTMAISACSPLTQFLPRTNGANQNPTTVSTPAAGIPVSGSQASVTVADQTTDGTSVVVAKVISQGPGWMAIHDQANGNIGPVIGVARINDGENDNVTVPIDSTKVTPTLYAMLHTDAGVIGTYEFPGPDVPVTLNGKMVAPSFIVTLGGSASGVTPAVTTHDQDVRSGKVIVDSVVSNGPGWVDIHIQKPDGTAGKEIGYTAVKSGENRNVTVTIDASQATENMFAMLHTDAGTVGVFENPGPDAVVKINGQAVSMAFKSGAAAVALGTPGGSPLTPPATTAQPAATSPASPATPGQGVMMVTPSGGINPLVKVSDQNVQNGAVKVDDAISTGPGWLVIYTVKNGQPDQVIGEAHLNDGDNPNVTVQVDQSKVTDQLYAQLHVDGGTVGTFEFPGPDVPVMLGVQMISGIFNSRIVASAPTQTSALTPMIMVQDQSVHNGAIIVPHVVSVGDDWLVIHVINTDGSPGDYIGFALLQNGINDNVIVHIDTSRATRTLFAMLHVNASKASTPQFPGADVPVMVGGQMLLPAFKITGPMGGDIPLAIGKNSAGVNILTDGLGMSLYLSLNDQSGKSNCTGDCLKTWHPLLATGVITPETGVSVNKIGVIFLPDRTRQVTYGGSPLYYYSGDQNPGDTKGQGVDGSWFLVTP